MTIRSVGGSSKSEAPAAKTRKSPVETNATSGTFLAETLAVAQAQIALAAQSAPNPDAGTSWGSGLDAIAGIAAAANAAGTNADSSAHHTPDRTA